MKNKRNIRNKYIHCTNDMVEKVIAFAEGTLDEKEYEAIYEHIAECNHCRYLLEEFADTEEDNEEGIDVTPKISFKLENDAIYALTPDHVVQYTTANVLSSNVNTGVIDYKITWFSNPILIRAIACNNTIVLEIHTQTNDAVYYLSNKERQLRANVYNGIASFENIEKGLHLLSENKKHFAIIEII